MMALRLESVPLADASGLVAGLLHEFSEGDFAGGHPPPLAPAWVATREQGRTGRPAHGLRVEGSEEGTFLGQLIEPGESCWSCSRSRPDPRSLGHR